MTIASRLFFGLALVVAMLTPVADAQTLETLHSFTLTDGAFPAPGSLLYHEGALYGTTVLGGTSKNCVGGIGVPPPGCGTVFEITP